MNKKLGLVTNLINERTLLLRRHLEPTNAKNVDLECGHPFAITIQDYKEQFERGDMAARVVSLYPDECWSTDPEVYETDEEEKTTFEKAWEKLEQDQALYSYMHRVDVMSGIGRFGVLLFGFDDGGSLDTEVPLIPYDAEIPNDPAVKPANNLLPVNGKAKEKKPTRQLLFVRAFDESVVTVSELEDDVKNPRYGMPKFYQVQFTSEALTTQKTLDVKVHWSRVLHVCDNRGNSEIFGSPRMKRVFNRLLDLAKIAGSSAEMFWKGGFPGLSLETLPQADEQIEFDREATKKQVEAYMDGLQRYIATIGMNVKSLSVQIADPRPQVEVQIRLIASALSVPWRLLLGVEVGALASEQDVRSWNRRMQRRRLEYINPFILRPIVKRLVQAEVLPKPKELLIAWDDLNSPADKDKAVIAERRTNALLKYVQGAVDRLVPPFHFLTLVVGMTDAEATAIIKKAGDAIKNLGPVVDPNAQPPNAQPNAGPNAQGRPGKGTAARKNGTAAPTHAGPAGGGRDRSMSAATLNADNE